jgi:hypothetical protein
VRSERVFTLNTWGFMWFHDDPEIRRAGGLPNDFLERGVAALLLFDRVIVDSDAFDAEMRFAGRWV